MPGMRRGFKGLICMSDFWRLANVIIVVVIVVLLIFYKNRKKKGVPANLKSKQLDAVKNSKQKLSRELKAYANNVNQLEADSRQMLNDYFAQQEIAVKKLVKAEINAAMDEITANLEAEMRQSFDEAKDKLQK